MNIRRTSGEIVNATLLETFLALVFLIFGLAVFAQQQVDDAPSQDSFDALQHKVDSLLLLQRSRSDSLRNALLIADSLKGVLVSKYPPDCEPDATPREWLTITLLGPDQLHVLVNRTQFGHQQSEETDLTTGAFVRLFEPVHAEAERRRCRYLVRVIDTKATDKQEFKRALSAINTVFRPTDFLR